MARLRVVALRIALQQVCIDNKLNSKNNIKSTKFIDSIFYFIIIFQSVLIFVILNFRISNGHRSNNRFHSQLEKSESDIVTVFNKRSRGRG